MTDDDIRRARARVVDAKRRKRNQLAQLRGEPTGLIPAAPIRQRANALAKLGWSFEAIVDLAGIEATAAGLRLIATNQTRNTERKFAPVAELPVTLNVPETIAENRIVPSLGARRRIRALMAQGWRHEDITPLIGRTSHHLSSGRYPRMQALDWWLVDIAFDKLAAGHGGSTKTLTRARAAGYAPALAWDDIDDPTERPKVGSVIDNARAGAIDQNVVDRFMGGDYTIHANYAERLEIAARWIADQRPVNELERLTGWNVQRYTRAAS